MNQRRLWVSAAIIAFVIVVGFVLSVPHTRDVVHTSAPIDTAPIPSVTLYDSFKKGTHTITGSLEAQNACAQVTAHASMEGTASSSILVAISLASDTGVCLQLPTRMNFTASIAAPASLPFTVTVNGVQATTTSS